MKNPRLKDASVEELERELARRRAKDSPVDMTAMELAVELEEKSYGQLALQERLDQLEPEDERPRRCPRCGQPVPVKARDRKRVLRTVSGPVTLFRNYYYCGKCRHGFYPRDDELGLPTNGEVSRELERRLLDFAMNDSFEHAAERWNMLFREQVSPNLLRRITDRIGALSETCHDAALQFALKQPPAKPPKLLIVQNDGSMLPMRGREPWKEAKLAVLFNGEHWLPRRKGRRGAITESRYVGVLGPQKEFREALDIALRMERALKADTVVWVGDGAPGNWHLASHLVPACIQVLDFNHALEHAMTCAKVLLGETSPYLPLWKERVEQLLLGRDPHQILNELEQCCFLAPRKGRGALKELLRYFNSNKERMKYRDFKDAGYPIGSGVVESAHRHVLQRRMKNAGQHWSYPRARCMVRLRAAYRNAGPRRFHAALLEARQLTQTGRIPRYGPLKRRASNYGTTGVKARPGVTGRHSRY